MKISVLVAALSLASATAAIAAATQVNITDPRATTRAALVEPGQRLAVQQVAPSTFFHAVNSILGPGCAAIAVAPSNKALVIRQAHVTVYGGSASGSIPFVAFYASSGSGCTGGLVGDVLPTGIGGVLPYSFDPGVAVPAGGTFAVNNFGNYEIEIYVDGYTVAPGVAPPVGGQTIQVHGHVPTER
jgi:hypothetical protein